ncbi:hypothetical protein GIB67_032069 [Kingdonia uniflora]|uniref:RNase H type-1 domain-containing protein n=1 Tax=Kingdonia uniflora TaxID=39325 RepID=A0A7J7MX71_9MAGN|nr:hypothetical protein GIB67_032069 [Kingdonia uniflora]
MSDSTLCICWHRPKSQDKHTGGEREMSCRAKCKTGLPGSNMGTELLHKWPINIDVWIDHDVHPLLCTLTGILKSLGALSTLKETRLWPRLGNLLFVLLFLTFGAKGIIEFLKAKLAKPPPGYHAINTDGSLSEVGGFRATMRTEKGISVKAVTGRVRAQSIIIYELQGIEVGMLLGLKLEINKVILCIDSGEAYHLFNKNGKPPWQVQRLVERIKILMLRFGSCIVEQVFREANVAADNLSKIKPAEGFIELLPNAFSFEL